MEQITCEDAFRQLYLYLDRELPVVDARLIEGHLAFCDDCAQQYKFERAVIDRVRARLLSPVAPLELVERIGALLNSK